MRHRPLPDSTRVFCEDTQRPHPRVITIRSCYCARLLPRWLFVCSGLVLWKEMNCRLIRDVKADRIWTRDERRTMSKSKDLRAKRKARLDSCLLALLLALRASNLRPLAHHSRPSDAELLHFVVESSSGKAQLRCGT